MPFLARSWERFIGWPDLRNEVQRKPSNLSYAALG